MPKGDLSELPLVGNVCPHCGGELIVEMEAKWEGPILGFWRPTSVGVPNFFDGAEWEVGLIECSGTCQTYWQPYDYEVGAPIDAPVSGGAGRR